MTLQNDISAMATNREEMIKSAKSYLLSCKRVHDSVSKSYRSEETEDRSLYDLKNQLYKSLRDCKALINLSNKLLDVESKFNIDINRDK